MEKYNPGLCTYHRVSENSPDSHKEGKTRLGLIPTGSPNSQPTEATQPRRPGSHCQPSGMSSSLTGGVPSLSHPFLCAFEQLGFLRVTDLRAESQAKCP